ncbi:MAG: PIN domain-containing protein [Candidatus Rokubacteria bacterium]|nr:PIN domain-containing protein [Candidatus Rokubacteria bacterium]
MGLIADLGRGPVGLDTAVFIYFIEEHPRFLPVVAPVFSAIASARLPAVTSAVTLLETLVVPYRSGNVGLAARYEAVLTRSRGIGFIDLDRALIRTAAHLRALFPVRTPDALQLAAALSHGCRVYLTSDRALPRIPGLEILQVTDYAGAP